MIVESAQLLCSAHHMTGGTAPYRLTHKNHPCAIWCRETIENYKWLHELAVNLCAEFTFRRRKVHKTAEIIKILKRPPNLPSKQLTEFALSMPDVYKTKDAVESYRRYYINEKIYMKNGKRMDMWTNRERPPWFDSINQLSSWTVSTTKLFDKITTELDHTRSEWKPEYTNTLQWNDSHLTWSQINRTIATPYEQMLSER